MSTVSVNDIQIDEFRTLIPVSELGYRVIKQFRSTYTAGEWNNSTGYNWVPGMFVDYTPLSASSRIRVHCTIPMAGRNAAHAISHWIFYSNGGSTEVGRHSVSGQHYEDSQTYVWDFASWGTNNRRIGYQMRAYANDNHEVRVYATRYWNGGGSLQNCRGVFFLEEYLVQGGV